MWNDSHPIFVQEGDTFSLGISVTDDLGAPIDVSSASATFNVASSPKGAPSFTYSTDDYIEVESGTSNKFVLSIPPSVTKDWALRQYSYQFIMNLNGTVTTLLYGVLRVRPEVVDT